MTKPRTASIACWKNYNLGAIKFIAGVLSVLLLFNNIASAYEPGSSHLSPRSIFQRSSEPDGTGENVNPTAENIKFLLGLLAIASYSLVDGVPAGYIKPVIENKFSAREGILDGVDLENIIVEKGIVSVSYSHEGKQYVAKICLKADKDKLPEDDLKWVETGDYAIKIVDLSAAEKPRSPERLVKKQEQERSSGTSLSEDRASDRAPEETKPTSKEKNDFLFGIRRFPAFGAALPAIQGGLQKLGLDTPGGKEFLARGAFEFLAPIFTVALLLVIGITVFYLFKAIIKQRPPILKDLDVDRSLRGLLDKALLPPKSGVSQEAILREYVAQSEKTSALISQSDEKCKEIIKQIEKIVHKGRLSPKEISTILQLNYTVINVIPLVLMSNTDNLRARARLVSRLSSLMDRTIDKAIRSVPRAADPMEKRVLSLYAGESIKIGRYYADYMSALGYVEDIAISRGYGGAKGKYSWWQEQWGIKAISISGHTNLAYLLQKVHTRGNAIVPNLYSIDGDSKTYCALVKGFYRNLKKDSLSLGISTEWGQRKGLARMIPLVYAMSMGAITTVLSLPTLIGASSVAGLASFLIKLTISMSSGFLISTGLSWYFIAKGWKHEIKEYSVKQSELNKRERILRKMSASNKAAEKGTTKDRMVDAQRMSAQYSLKREVDLRRPATADLILVMTENEKENIAELKDILRSGGLTRRDVPVYTASGHKDMGNAFLEAYALLDQEAAFGELLGLMDSKKGISSVDGERIKVSPEKLRKKVKDMRIIILYNRAREHKCDMPNALANGYRITQVMNSGNKTGIVNIKTNGTYEGPAWSPSEGITIFSSWKDIEGMMRQKLGLIIADENGVIRKYYEKFGLKRIRNWLEREVVSGRYELDRPHKVQMTIATNIFITTSRGRDIEDLMKVLKEVDRYRHLATAGKRGRVPINVTLDIIVPLVMLSQGENIYTYLEARLSRLREDAPKGARGATGLSSAEEREFYFGLFNAIEKSYPKDRKIVFNAQTPYPHESSYDRSWDINGENMFSPLKDQSKITFDGEITEEDLVELFIDRSDRTFDYAITEKDLNDMAVYFKKGPRSAAPAVTVLPRPTSPERAIKAAKDNEGKVIESVKAAAKKFMTDLAIRSHSAKEQNQKIIIGLDTSWMPPEQFNATSLLNLINELTRLCRKEGFKNISIVRGHGPDLADGIRRDMQRALEQGMNVSMSNIIIIGRKEIIDASSFAWFKTSADPAGRAYFVEIETERGFASNGDLRILEIIAAAVNVCNNDGRFSGAGGFIAVETDKNNVKRFRFKLKAEPMDYEILRQKYDIQTKAIASQA